MQITARQFGEMMRARDVLWPAPVIDAEDMKLPDVSIYRIGQRQITSIFVFVRKGWATIYARPSYDDRSAYRGYRAAFDLVMPNDSMGRQVDHLFPKSKGKAGEYVALGRISNNANNSWSDSSELGALSNKILNMDKSQPARFTSTLTWMQLGWGAVTCYIRPFAELNQNVLTRHD